MCAVQAFAHSSFFRRNYQYFILIGVALFYLPYLSRYFMADDWLWLAYGQDAFTRPELFLERPVYGYLRPVYLLYVATLIKLFGPNPFLINLGMLALHVLNCYLFFRLLVRLGGRDAVTAVATIFFAFYALSCTSICWISAGSDLLALSLLLGFCHVLIDYHQRGGVLRLVMLLVLGLASALTKEFGVMGIGLFFAYFLLRRVNPFGRRYLPGTIAMLILYAAYIVYYFSTRTVVEKELVLSWRLPINLWYLCIYLLLPLSRRTVGAMGETVKVTLLVLRTAVMLAAPLVPYNTVGFFMAAIMAVSSLVTLVLLPSLMNVLRRRLAPLTGRTEDDNETDKPATQAIKEEMA